MHASVQEKMPDGHVLSHPQRLRAGLNPPVYCDSRRGVSMPAVRTLPKKILTGLEGPGTRLAGTVQVKIVGRGGGLKGSTALGAGCEPRLCSVERGQRQEGSNVFCQAGATGCSAHERFQLDEARLGCVRRIEGGPQLRASADRTGPAQQPLWTSTPSGCRCSGIAARCSQPAGPAKRAEHTAAGRSNCPHVGVALCKGCSAMQGVGRG